MHCDGYASCFGRPTRKLHVIDNTAGGTPRGIVAVTLGVLSRPIRMLASSRTPGRHAPRARAPRRRRRRRPRPAPRTAPRPRGGSGVTVTPLSVPLVREQQRAHDPHAPHHSLAPPPFCCRLERRTRLDRAARARVARDDDGAARRVDTVCDLGRAGGARRFVLRAVRPMPSRLRWTGSKTQTTTKTERRAPARYRVDDGLVPHARRVHDDDASAAVAVARRRAPDFNGRAAVVRPRLEPAGARTRRRRFCSYVVTLPECQRGDGVSDFVCRASGADVAVARATARAPPSHARRLRRGGTS